MLAPNTLLQNRYLVVRPIGRGGMGAVYLARDQRLGHTVALKETFFSEERMRRAFEREARLLAHLRHPALPKVTDHFEEEGGQFIVMEFIAGEDLEMLLARRGTPFEVGRVLAWGDELLKALDYLHAQDPPILHRDIKPANLKLTPQGEVILLDFGLAKGTAGQTSSVMTSRSVHGFTPNFAPLEQIQGTGTGPRSDLYSLAATLYYLMTGAIPPDALTRITEVANGQPDPLRRPDELDPSIPRAVADLLMRAMAHNREQRPANASEMRRLLREAFPTAWDPAAREAVAGGRADAAGTLDGKTVMHSTLVEASPTEAAESAVADPAAGARPAARPTDRRPPSGLKTAPLDEMAPPTAERGRSWRLPWAAAGFAALMLIAVTIGLVSNFSSDKPQADISSGVSSKEATKDAGATAADVKSQAVPAPDDSEISTTYGEGGAEVKTRTFRSNQWVSRVVVTSLGGLRKATVFSRKDEARELPEAWAATALEASGDSLASAAGFNDAKEQKTAVRKSAPAAKAPTQERASGTAPNATYAPKDGIAIKPTTGAAASEQKKAEDTNLDISQQAVKGSKKPEPQRRVVNPPF